MLLSLSVCSFCLFTSFCDAVLLHILLLLTLHSWHSSWHGHRYRPLRSSSAGEALVERGRKRRMNVRARTHRHTRTDTDTRTDTHIHTHTQIQINATRKQNSPILLGQVDSSYCRCFSSKPHVSFHNLLMHSQADSLGADQAGESLT